ncbi:MAG: C40 family peptidase [Treponema sp.]|nr:C40 family peptidase [Treponema sp.]
MDISKYIGCKYIPHGRDPEKGLDCYGLAICIFRDMGITLPDPIYGDTDIETNKRLMGQLEKTIPNTEIEMPEPGCIIEFMVLGEPSHIGVYIGNGNFIHCSQTAGVVVDKLYRWKNRVKGYYRI